MNVVDVPKPRQAASAAGDGMNPFVGARPFLTPPASHHAYCARQIERRALMALLRDSRALILHGAAGVGKTSLLHAGLLPDLVAAGFTILATQPNWTDDELFAWLEHVRATPSCAACILVIDPADRLAAPGADGDGNALRSACLSLLADKPHLRVLFSVRSPQVTALDERIRQAGIPVQEFALHALAPTAIGTTLARLPGCVDAAALLPFLAALGRPTAANHDGPGDAAVIEPTLLQIAGRALWPLLPDDAAGLAQRVDAALADHCLGSLDAALARYPGLVSAYELGAWATHHLLTTNGASTLVHRTATETAGLPNLLIDALEDGWLLRTVRRGGNCWVGLLDPHLGAPLQQALARLATATPLAQSAVRWAASGRDPRLLLDSNQAESAIAAMTANPARYGVLERDMLATSVAALGVWPGDGGAPTPPRLAQARRLTLVAMMITCVLLALSLWALTTARTAERAQQTALAQLSAQATALAETGAQAGQLQRELTAAQAEVAAAAAQSERNEQLGRALRAGQLAGAALLRRDDAPTQALLYAVESLRVQQQAGEPPVPEAVQALRDLLATLGGRPLTVPGEDISALALSDDGQYVVAGDTSGLLHLWRATGDAVVQPVAAHAGPVWAMAWLPDGRLVSTGADGVARIWQIEPSDDAVGITPATQIPLGSGELFALDVAAANRWIATGGADGIVHVWAVDVSASLQIAATHDAPINVVRFAPDSSTLASGSLDGQVLLSTLVDGAGAASSQLTMHDGAVNALAFSPDGRWLASAGADGSLTLYDRKTSATTNLAPHASAVNTVAFAADSQWLASADDDGLVRLWSVADPRTPIPLRGHRNSVRRLAFLPTATGPRLLTISYDRTARLWDYLHPESNPVVLRGHDDQLTHLALAAGGRFATASYDRTVRLWAADTPYTQPERMLAAGLPQGELALAPDGARLVASSLTRPYAEVWDTDDGRVLFRLEGHNGTLAALAFSPDGTRIFTGGRDGRVRIWRVDGDGPGMPGRTLAGHVGPVNSLAVHPEGLLLASGGDDTTVRLWDILDGELRQALAGHSAAVMGVAFSPDGATLASADRAGTLLLWDVATGARQQTLAGDGTGFLAVDFRADGRWVAAAAEDGAIWIWDLAALALGPTTLRRHTTEVNTLAFSPSGDLLASADADGLLYLWDLTRLSAPPVVVRAHPASVNALGFADGGAALYTAGADGVIRRWVMQLDDLIDGACTTAGRNLTPAEWDQVFDTAPYRPTCPGFVAQR